MMAITKILEVRERPDISINAYEVIYKETRALNPNYEGTVSSLILADNQQRAVAVLEVVYDKEIDYYNSKRFNILRAICDLNFRADAWDVYYTSAAAQQVVLVIKVKANTEEDAIKEFKLAMLDRVVEFIDSTKER